MFLSYAISAIGNWFDVMAVLVLFSFTWEESPFMVSLVPLTYAVPSILFGQAAGVWVDRSSKLRLMILSDWVRFGLTVLLLFAPEAWTMLAVLFLRSLAANVQMPAQTSLTRHAVAEEHLLQASSLFGLVFNLGKVIGPLLGSGLIAVASPQWCIGVNAACFLISAVLLMMIGKIPEDEPAVQAKAKDGTAASGLGAWKEGWAVLLTKRSLAASTMYFLVGMFVIQIVDAQFGILIREARPEEPELVGWIMSSVGIGAALYAFTLGRKKEIASYGTYLGLGSILMGGAFAMMWLVEVAPLWVICLCGAVAGIGVGMVFTLFSYICQVEPPKEMVGRVNGITNSLSSLVIVVAPLLGSVLVEEFGVMETYEWTGLALVAVGVLGLVFQKWIWGSREAAVR